jgi:hypothetical protein
MDISLLNLTDGWAVGVRIMETQSAALYPTLDYFGRSPVICIRQAFRFLPTLEAFLLFKADYRAF